MFATQRPGVRLIGAEAATKKAVKKKAVVKATRTVKLTYQGGCTAEFVTPVVKGATSPGACTNIGAANWALASKVGEKFVSLSVTDQTGRAVPGQFWEKGSGTANDTEIGFCGSMKNYQIPAAGSILLDLDAVGAVPSCPGIATQGTVTLTFSNLP